MRDQQRERRGRHAVDPAGLADGARPMSRRASAATSFESPGSAGVVEVVRQVEALVAAVGGDIGRLAVEIDLVLGVDLELLGDVRLQVAPSCGQIRQRLRRSPMFGYDSSSNAVRRWPSLLSEMPMPLALRSA